MALETMKGVTKLDGFDVVTMDDLREKHPERFTETGAMDHVWFEETIRPHNFVYVRHDKNSIAFTIQNGPVKEAGVNGCQVTTLIAAAKHMIEQLQVKYPCVQNAETIFHLSEALHYQLKRTENRTARGVEGTSAV